jgi:hypothetical protein
VGSAVSFWKGMDIIHIVNDDCGLLREFRPREPSQEALALGLLVALGAAGREAFRLKAARLEASQPG